ncbi:expressed unknown protein [Seminavis robusta]|uniref:Uncharacterized protein n=1 Tax=Seminavis robusta TaxID=568900 RepID=A0A9N8HM15_9STRA|nr:expressed unknown protein [Seminavis robusta]|eukprot:Sro869_g213550.1 n/a (301) ;mRNA; f:41732-42634
MITLAAAFSTAATDTTAATTSDESHNDNNPLPPLHLDLSDQQFNDDNNNSNNNNILFHQDVIHAWQQAPTFVDRLATLHLTHNKISDQEFQALLALLFRRRTNQNQQQPRWASSIQDLEVSADNLAEQGILQLAQIIQNYQPNNPRSVWKRLCLCGNISAVIQEAVLPPLAKAMQSNVFLEGVIVGNISGSDWPKQSSVSSPRHAINYYTMLNKGGRRWILRGNETNDTEQHRIPLALWPLLLERINLHTDLFSRYQEDQENARINVIHNLVVASQGFRWGERRGLGQKWREEELTDRLG